MPAAAGDPFPGLCRPRRRRNPCQDLVPRRRVSQFQLHLRFADAGEVAVAFDQPGDDQLPANIEDLCGGTAEPGHVRGRPDKDDAIAAHRDGLRLGRAVLHGQHAAVRQQQIGRQDRLAGSGRHHRQEREGYDELITHPH